MGEYSGIDASFLFRQQLLLTYSLFSCLLSLTEMSSPFGGVAGSEVGSMSFSLDDSSIEMFEESFLDDNSSNMFEESSHDMMEQSSHSSSHSSVDELSNSFGGVDVNDVVDDPDPTPVISDESRDPSIRLEPRRLNFSDVMNDSEESADFIPNQGSLPPSDNNNTFYHDEDVEADEDVASDVDEYEDVEGDHEDDDELPSFDMAEIEDMFHCDVNHFPSPILSGNQGTLLHQVTCSFDVDSIYFVGEGPSQVCWKIGACKSTSQCHHSPLFPRMSRHRKCLEFWGNG